jgi:hypothetical protein
MNRRIRLLAALGAALVALPAAALVPSPGEVRTVVQMPLAVTEVVELGVPARDVETVVVRLNEARVPVPERAGPVELLGHDPGREVFQLIVATGSGQRGVTHVVVDVEDLVVDPHGVILEGDPLEALAVARDQVEDGEDRPFEGGEVDATALRGEGAAVEDLRGRHVHVHVRPFGHEKGVVLRAQTLVRVATHRPAIPDETGAQVKVARRAGRASTRRVTIRFANPLPRARRPAPLD